MRLRKMPPAVTGGDWETKRDANLHLRVFYDNRISPKISLTFCYGNSSPLHSKPGSRLRVSLVEGALLTCNAQRDGRALAGASCNGSSHEIL